VLIPSIHRRGCGRWTVAIPCPLLMNQWGEEENCGMDDGGCPRCCLCTANDDDYDDDESLFNSTEPNSQRHVMLMAIDRMCYAVWFTVVCSGNDTSTWRWCSRRWLWERWATDRRKSLLENPVTTLRTPTNKTADNTIVLRVVLYRTSASIVLSTHVGCQPLL
jgi:hypothetical protein